MKKTIYILAWILLAAVTLMTVITNNINPITILVISFIAFGLAYGFALWLAFSIKDAPTTNNQARR